MIGTAYSGNMDFMTAENSYLLDYSLVTLTRDYGPYFRGAVWADPDVDHAAPPHPQVVEHPSEAAVTAAGAHERRRTRMECRRDRPRRAQPAGGDSRRSPDRDRGMSGRGHGRLERIPDSETALIDASKLRDRLAKRLAAQRRWWRRSSRRAAGCMTQLSLMERSAGRRMYLDFREAAVRALLAFRHPVWTVGSLPAALAASTRAPADARDSRPASSPPYLSARVSSPPVAERTDQPDDFTAIRWIGPTRIRHEVLESLLCHPSSAVHYRVNVPSDSDFVTSCALSPNAWRHHAGAVDFRVHLEIPKTGWAAVRECRLDPARRYTDRRWHQLRIPLPPLAEPAAEVMVSLETDAAPGSDTGHAWALFGEPRFEWKRPQAEVRRRFDCSSTGCETMAGARRFARLSHGRSAEEEAAEYTQWVSTHTRSNLSSKPMAADIAALPISRSSASSRRCSTPTPRWLRACIESVRRQIYPHWELCLCDDASSAPGPAEVFARVRQRSARPHRQACGQRRHFGRVQRRGRDRAG